MDWLKSAEQAHGEATDAVQQRIEERYGLQTALRAEDDAMWYLEAMAEDFARRDAGARLPVVTPEHVAIAAAAYSYRPSTAVRLAAMTGRIGRVLGVAARTA